jgi:riboflavin biosynthesis pyrimidine reductase
MYETMVYWETAEPAQRSPASRDYAEIWRAAEKVVYSRSLQAVSSARTRIERELDLDAIRHLTESSATDVSIGGPGVAGQALAGGVVDEVHLFLGPIVIGGGKRALPDGVRAQLELVDVHRFGSGVVYLRYRVGA